MPLSAPPYRVRAPPESRRSTSDPRSEVSLFPDSAGNKGRFAQPAVRFPIFGINDNMLVVVWGLGVLRRDYGGTRSRYGGGERGLRGRPDYSHLAAAAQRFRRIQLALRYFRGRRF